MQEMEKKKYQHTVIMGDFNYPNINWENHSGTLQQEIDFIKGIQNCYLYQHVTKPTRARGTNKPNLLDLDPRKIHKQ